MSNQQWAEQSLMQGNPEAAAVYALQRIGDSLDEIANQLKIHNGIQAHHCESFRPESDHQEASQPTPVEDELTHGSGGE